MCVAQHQAHSKSSQNGGGGGGGDIRSDCFQGKYSAVMPGRFLAE